ncbi:MAG: hypothetical protein KC464_25980 [Myxococcales bacterium]|nr:hypothetical protein [Myxococcales bacterium]
MSDVPSPRPPVDGTVEPGAPPDTVLAAAAAGDLATVADWFAARAPCDDEQALQWWLLLVSLGLTSVAEPLFRRLAEGPHAAAVARVVESAADGLEPVSGPGGGEDPLLDIALPAAERANDEELVAHFLTWFGGRRDLYARQWYDERRRRSGYHPVEEPLTAAVVRDHLAGRVTIGQYLLFPDATSSFGVIDLDLAASALAELHAGHGDDAPTLSHGGLRGYALAILDAAERLGLPLFAEDSGGKGVHLWLFLQPRRAARAVRSLLAQVIQTAGPQPPEVGVEIFPKQDRLGPRGLSSLVKLPLGTHRATLRRCPLLDRQLMPIDDPRDALAALRTVAPDLVDDLLGRRLVILPTSPLPADPPLPAPATVPSRPRELGELLREIEVGAEATAASDRVMAGCAIVRGLVERGYRQRRLSPEEARALTYTLGLIGPGPNLADEVFAAVQASRRELARVRRGLPAPSGCQRLRRLEGATPCASCAMDRRAMPYPTPTLFAVGARPAARPAPVPFAGWTADEELLTDPVTEISRRLQRIEDRLATLGRKDEP